MKHIMRQSVAGFLFCIAVLSICFVHAAEEVETNEPPAEQKFSEVNLSRQIRINEAWHEAEVFTIEPAKKVNMRVVCPQAEAAAVVSELIPGAIGSQTLSLSSINEYQWNVPYGIAVRLSENEFEWVAPAGPGHYKIDCHVKANHRFNRKDAGGAERQFELQPIVSQTTFHFLVPHEFDPEGPGVIEGYPIGVYPRETDTNVKAIVAAHRDRYRPPKWFVAVTPETADLRVSEHFRLREFLPNAPKDKTAYFPYNPDLCQTLEALHEELKVEGVKNPRVRILRGFISPYEVNRLRRQGVEMLTWNRYQYGDAVLIIVDCDLDDKMDDLNGDGEINADDAQLVASVIRRVQENLQLPGWIGVFATRPDKTLPETPMTGFDLRGWKVETFE